MMGLSLAAILWNSLVAGETFQVPTISVQSGLAVLQDQDGPAGGVGLQLAYRGVFLRGEYAKAPGDKGSQDLYEPISERKALAAGYEGFPIPHLMLGAYTGWYWDHYREVGETEEIRTVCDNASCRETDVHWVQADGWARSGPMVGVEVGSLWKYGGLVVREEVGRDRNFGVDVRLTLPLGFEPEPEPVLVPPKVEPHAPAGVPGPDSASVMPDSVRTVPLPPAPRSEGFLIQGLAGTGGAFVGSFVGGLMGVGVGLATSDSKSTKTLIPTWGYALGFGGVLGNLGGAILGVHSVEPSSRPGSGYGPATIGAGLGMVAGALLSNLADGHSTAQGAILWLGTGFGAAALDRAFSEPGPRPQVPAVAIFPTRGGAGVLVLSAF